MLIVTLAVVGTGIAAIGAAALLQMGLLRVFFKAIEPK